MTLFYEETTPTTGGFDAAEMATRWHAAIAEENLLADEPAKCQQRLERLTDRLVTIVGTPTRDPSEARAVGVDLATLGWDKPRLLGRSQALLQRELLNHLSPERRQLLQPRLAEALGEMALGFFETQSHELARRNRAYLRSVGHELIAPLNAVVGFGRLLTSGFNGPLDESQREDIAGMLEAGQEMTTLLRGVMELSKGEGGALPISRESLPLRPLVEAVIDGTLAMQRKRDVELIVTWEELPDTIESDEGHLRTILQTLLSFATWTSPHTTLRLASERPEEATICFELANLDLSYEKATAMLDAILEIDEAGSQPYAGDALGLVHAYYLTRRLGGQLTIGGEPGRRATMRLTLPR